MMLASYRSGWHYLKRQFDGASITTEASSAKHVSAVLTDHTTLSINNMIRYLFEFAVPLCWMFASMLAMATAAEEENEKTNPLERMLRLSLCDPNGVCKQS
ncbi:uncharacterized protein LOC141911382 [Tubulanus polymorphus]|uniref:uncharacterized protein LOC141911382 n=1 Tax=Tubulanus polymorphus TaxID=672921 RepID=UPI003DA20693